MGLEAKEDVSEDHEDESKTNADSDVGPLQQRRKRKMIRKLTRTKKKKKKKERTNHEISAIDVVILEKLLAIDVVALLSILAFEGDSLELVDETNDEGVFVRRGPVGPDPPAWNRGLEQEEAVEEQHDCEDHS